MIIIYTLDDLKEYKFFNSLDTSALFDSLTGVISRQYILEFAKHLIQNKTPFSMCMIDIDNFKNINDTYGHNFGDIVLKDIANGLIKFVGKEGLVGRFGGDEFIIINLKAYNYDALHEFYTKMFECKYAIRREFEYEGIKIFITGTIGSATYPLDAQDYSDLFAKMDKALYRGKIKGRNCFIIYVHAKHKDIVVKERGTNSLIDQFTKVTQLMETEDSFKLTTDIIDYLYRILHPYNIMFINDKNYLWSGRDTKFYHYDEEDAFSIFDEMLKNKIFIASTKPEEIIKKYPATANFLKTRNVHTFILGRVGKNGFIGLYENSITRIWQDNDLALLFFVARELAHKLEK